MASGPLWRLCIGSLPPAVVRRRRCLGKGGRSARGGALTSCVDASEDEPGGSVAPARESFGMEQGPAQCGNELPDQRPQPPPALPHMTHLDCLQRLGGGKALRWHGGAVAGAMRGRAAVASSRRATPKTHLHHKTCVEDLRDHGYSLGRKTCGGVMRAGSCNVTEGAGQAPPLIGCLHPFIW